MKRLMFKAHQNLTIRAKIDSPQKLDRGLYGTRLNMANARNEKSLVTA